MMILVFIVHLTKDNGEKLMLKCISFLNNRHFMISPIFGYIIVLATIKEEPHDTFEI